MPTVTSNPTGKKQRGYFFYLLIFLAVSAGFDCKAIFWEWKAQENWLLDVIAPYVLCLIAACIGTLQLFMFKNAMVRIMAFFCMTINNSYLAFYVIMEDRFPDLTDAAISFDGLSDFMAIGISVFQVYTAPIAAALAYGAVVTAELAILGNRAAKNPRGAVHPAIALALLGAAVCGCSLMPSPAYSGSLYVKTPGLALQRLQHMTTKLYRGPRAEPELEPTRARDFASHIILIMDESIPASALQVNGCKYDTTPYLASRRQPFFNNYGIAVSAGNFSALSNILVVSGIQTSQLPDDGQMILRQASLFGYAKKAGRSTFYIDAQNQGMQNHLSVADLRDMTYLSVREGGTPPHSLDRVGLEKVVETIQTSPVPTFTFLLKTGAHIPYDDKFPPEFIDRKWGVRASRVDHLLTSLSWTVDEFLRELEKELRGTDVIVVYTSDHGQNIELDTDQEKPSRFLYGTRRNPSRLEAEVPLFIWALSERALDEYNRAGGFNPSAYNRASHFQLFPTLLTLMGYDHDEVRDKFGPTLFDPPYEKRYFATWHRISLLLSRDNSSCLFSYD